MQQFVPQWKKTKKKKQNWPSRYDPICIDFKKEKNKNQYTPNTHIHQDLKKA